MTASTIMVESSHDATPPKLSSGVRVAAEAAEDTGAAEFSSAAARTVPERKRGRSQKAPLKARRMLFKLLDALDLTYHVGKTDTELIVDHHDLAVGDQRAVYEHVEGLARQTLKLDDRALV